MKDDPKVTPFSLSIFGSGGRKTEREESVLKSLFPTNNPKRKIIECFPGEGSLYFRFLKTKSSEYLGIEPSEEKRQVFHTKEESSQLTSRKPDAFSLKPSYKGLEIAPGSYDKGFLLHGSLHFLKTDEQRRLLAFMLRSCNKVLIHVLLPVDSSTGWFTYYAEKSGTQYSCKIAPKDFYEELASGSKKRILDMEKSSVPDTLGPLYQDRYILFQ